MFRKLWSVVAVFVVVALLAGSFTMVPAASAEGSKTKVAFVYVAPVGDMGWTYAHDLGRMMLEEELGVETAYIENVPEGPDAERVIRDYAQKGYNVIFTTSFGFMDPTITVAEEFPDTYFEHCSGYKTAPNSSTYFGRMYQPRFLSGLVAGAATETNKIGFVAAFPIPEVIRGINAFTLGVRAANPEATVHVVWTNTWFGPSQEKEAAEALLAEGCDIIAQHQDTTEPQKAAQEKGLVSIGYDSDMGAIVGDSVLTSPMWDWGPYYVRRVQEAMDGTWETGQHWGSMADGIVKLADFSPKVPDDVKAQVKEYEDKILSGEWDVFTGPIKGQGGELAVLDGVALTDPQMLSMDWFVEGVQGEAPGEPPSVGLTVILSAYSYLGEDGETWLGESGPFFNAMTDRVDVSETLPFSDKAFLGQLYGQNVLVITQGTAKLEASESAMDLIFSEYMPRIQEVLWSGISGFSPQVGGYGSGGEPTVIGDVCVADRVGNWDLTFSSMVTQSFWPMSWPNAADKAIGDKALAEELYQAALQVDWPEVPSGPAANFAKYFPDEPVRFPKAWYGNCCELTSDNFWHSSIDDEFAREQVAALFGTSADQVIAVTAMEVLSWMNAFEDYEVITGRHIPMAYVRSSSNFDQPWDETSVSGKESIDAGMDQGGSDFGCITAALPILKMLELRAGQ